MFIQNHRVHRGRDEIGRVFLPWSVHCNVVRNGTQIHTNVNSQILGLILQSQMRKFVMINPQNTNLQISLVSQVRKFVRKKTVFLIKIRIGLPLILFYLGRYILDYKMPCNESILT
jgi:hypothetical protein